jgi:hypothetical protein
MQFGDRPTFRRNITSIFRFEGQAKQKTGRSRRQAEGYVMKLSLTTASADVLFGVLFDSEYRGSMFLRNLEASSKYSIYIYLSIYLYGSLVG